VPERKSKFILNMENTAHPHIEQQPIGMDIGGGDAQRLCHGLYDLPEAARHQEHTLSLLQERLQQLCNAGRELWRVCCQEAVHVLQNIASQAALIGTGKCGASFQRWHADAGWSQTPGRVHALLRSINPNMHAPRFTHSTQPTSALGLITASRCASASWNSTVPPMAWAVRAATCSPTPRNAASSSMDSSEQLGQEREGGNC
jgi:hypothetical protein